MKYVPSLWRNARIDVFERVFRDAKCVWVGARKLIAVNQRNTSAFHTHSRDAALSNRALVRTTTNRYSGTDS